MNTSKPVLAALLSLSTLLPFALRTDDSEAPQSSKDEPIAEMDWLAGSWSGDMWGGKFHAYYSTPSGGKILSHSRLLHGEKISFFEFEVFEEEGEHVVMQPYPGGKKAVSLTLVAVEEKERKATFENPTKDYPTRITYQRTSDEDLVIELSDPHGKSEKVERFELKRVDTDD